MSVKHFVLWLIQIALLSSCTFDLSLTSKSRTTPSETKITSALIPINSTNQSSYPVSGTCVSGANLDINLAATSLATVTCASGEWSANLDATSAPEGTNQLTLTETGNAAALDSGDVLKDTQAPTLTGTIDDGTALFSLTNSPVLTWTPASDTTSGILKYQIALGSSSGGVDILTWTDIDLVTSTTLTGLTLTNGNTYYPSVRAVDAAGNISTPILGDGWQITAGSGTAIVTAGLPTSPSANNSISLTVGGTDVVAYKFKFGLQGTTDCTNSSGYSSEVLVATALTGDISNFDDGNFTVCLVGKDSGSNYQSFAAATEYTWVRNAPAQIQFASLGQLVDEDSAGTVSFDFSLNHRKSTDVTVEYDVQGTAIYMLNHNLASNTVTIPAGSLTATVSFQIYGDALILPETYLRVLLVDMDSQKLIIGQNKTHTVVIKDNDGAMPYKTISEMSYGQTHGCLIYSSGDLYCWGANRYGQLGNNSLYDLAQPTLVGTGYAKVSANGSHTCAIKTDSKLWCWGNNGYGQLGVGNTTTYRTPRAVDAATDFIAVSAGRSHTCAITSAKKLKCWGYNGNGELGNNSMVQQTSPVPVDAAADYIAVATGYQHSCGILDASGVLKCWGSNDDSQLGDSGLSGDQLTPYIIDSGTSYKFISAGAFGSCGITSNDDLKCWGGNYNGEVGDISNWYPDPAVVDPGVKYSFVSTGIETTHYEPHSCGVTTTNEVKCWGGDSDYGRIGIGKSWDYFLPTSVDPGVSYTKIFAGSYNTCGMTQSGLPKCWGSSEFSQSLSIPGVISTPMPIYPERSFKSIWLADGGCAIDSTDKAWCWYSDDKYDLPESQMVRRDSANSFKAATSNCVIQMDGVLLCYQSGTWTTVDSGTTYKSIAQGGSYGLQVHYCGITSADDLKCWGYNDFGQVGNNTTTDVASPTLIDSGTSYKKVSASAHHTCAITSTDKVKCWGLGTSGQLGDAGTSTRLVPTLVSDGSDYLDISAGKSHTCGIIAGNQAKCWGYNADGQLGNGNTTQQNSPVTIDNTETYSQITAGYMFTCAVTVANKLKCWGSNTDTFLGANSPASYLGTGNYNTRETTPVAIDSSVDYGQVFASPSGRKACALTTAGKLKCWGQAASEHEVSLPIAIDAYRPNFSINVLHPSF